MIAFNDAELSTVNGVADEAKSTNRASSKSSKPVTAGGSVANKTTAASSSSVEAERSVAVKAVAAELLQMLLPALLKMSKAAVRKSLQDDQVRKGALSQSLIHAINRFLFGFEGGATMHVLCLHGQTWDVCAGTRQQQPWRHL